MTLNLTQYLNKTILVSIPALFEDDACRHFTLLGVELNGLWLQSDELNGRLLTGDDAQLAEMAPVVFVPFAQIAGVLVTTGPPSKEWVQRAQKAQAIHKPHPKAAEKHSRENDAEDRHKRKGR